MAQVYLAGDLRNGVTFEMGSSVYKVIEYQHVKPGKGPAFIRTKIKNVMTGAVIEKTFNPTERFQGAEIIKRSAVQFSSFAFFFSAYSSSVLSVPLTFHIVNEESDSFITIVIIQTASPGDNIFFFFFF